ncbi:response regulator [Acidaminobacter sp. JC074]|uniref:response regulator transcription factor n=1 Tax=Acidaminobacter sp. JC074 TaxID=2530199 RepID=UPI001F0F257B|nr:response regulator [Acidaminobacter sp. JC074]
MFDIVIIDDEALAIRKLEILLDQIDLDINSISHAENGLDGYHLIKTIKPNLIFTDIQMPLMDGLEMIRKLRADGIDTPIIILSCHENFSYAKEAIRLNTYDYLVKDLLDINKLENLFSRLLAEESKVLFNRKKLNQNLSTGLHQLLDTIHEPSLELLKQHFANESPAERYVLFQLKLNFLSAFITNPLDYKALKKLEENLRGVLASQMILNIHNRNIVILTKVSSGPSRLKFITQCQSISALIVKVTKEVVDLYMITISQPFTKLDQIKTQYQHVKNVSKNLLPSKINPIFFADDTKYSTDLTYEIIDNNLKRLSSYIEDLDLVSIQQVIYRLFDTNENGFIQLSYLNYLHICLFSCLKSILNNNQLSTKKVFGRDYLSLDEIESLSHIKDIEAWYIDKFETIVAYLAKQKDNNYSPKIKQAISLIETNPTISLQQLSTALDMNKSYLCRLFKKEVEINLTEYTLKYRIERAKELLINTQYKISDVSRELGYVYPHQFSKDFKKVTQIMPTEYRKLHHKSY